MSYIRICKEIGTAAAPCQTEQLLYTVPSGKQAVVNYLEIFNQGDTARFTVTRQTGGGQFAPSYLLDKLSHENLGRFVLAADDSVSINAPVPCMVWLSIAEE